MDRKRLGRSMSRIRDRFIHIAAVTAVFAAVGTVPASAVETSASPDQGATSTVVVAAGEIRDAVPARKLATVSLPARRPKAVRALPAPASRPVAVVHRYHDCSGSWCGRQFVLMIGIGY